MLVITMFLIIFLLTSSYFARVNALNSGDKRVGYGRTTDAHKMTNMFGVIGISGRRPWLDITTVCFSAFAIVSLAFSRVNIPFLPQIKDERF